MLGGETDHLCAEHNAMRVVARPWVEPGDDAIGGPELNSPFRRSVLFYDTTATRH
jgi:hypothetical protein